MPDCRILAIVSGKGGVGKTMLTMALANELARDRKTLLVDLDFFNRGLAGLFARLGASARKDEIAPPEFLFRSIESSEIDPGEPAPWSIVEARQNLFTLHYGDLPQEVFNNLDRMDVEELRAELASWVDSIATRFRFDFVILDCHGGPDLTSFAACALADHTILVSEPDRITMHGTLHFLRALSQQPFDRMPNVHLVFNKVVPAFSSVFLFNFYNKYLKNEFHGKPLLAAFPLEVYLTKAFERNPFLTTIYPYSQLAQKSRLVLFDLFSADSGAPSLRIAQLSSLRRFLTRYYMGRWPALVQLDFMLKFIAISMIVVVGITAAFQIDHQDLRYQLGLPKESWDLVMFVVLLWCVVALAANWGRELDTYMTYFIRMRAYVKAFLIICVAPSFGMPLRTLSVHPTNGSWLARRDT
jgi:cellulose biosynthesis protein BcsQ